MIRTWPTQIIKRTLDDTSHLNGQSICRCTFDEDWRELLLHGLGKTFSQRYDMILTQQQTHS